MPNRSIAPESTPIKQFSITEGTHTVIHDVPVYQIHVPDNDVLKVEFYYSGGVRHQLADGIASACISLLPEGTTSRTAEAIAVALDEQGAYLQTHSGRDESCLTLYCLPKYLSACTPILQDVLQHASFSQHELDIYKENAMHSLVVNEQKTSYLARRRFAELLFGNDSAYGSAVNQEIISNISRETVCRQFEQTYRNKPKYILLAGNINPAIYNELEAILSVLGPQKNVLSGNPVTQTSPPGTYLVNKPDAVQSSVRMGKFLFNRNHPDYREMTVVNMILGGYFGSRLMKNIREEKGLTYGIYSSIDSYFDTGSFSVSVELNKDQVELGISEIRKELLRVASDPIDKNELQVVQNYYLGSFLRGFDGPFSLASYYKSLIDYNLNYAYYYEYPSVILNIRPERIQQLVQQYLNPDEMIVVVAGG